MRLTRHEMLPIGAARCAPMTLRDAAEPTIVETAMSFGVHPNAVTNFRRRHPECREWSLERICQQMQINKDQSAVARRQQVAGRRGFGRICYA